MIGLVFFLWLIESVFNKDSVELTEQVDLVPNKLESVVDICQMALLNDELLNIVNRISKNSDRFMQPHFTLISAFLNHIWYKFLNLIVESFRSWL